MEGHIQMVKNRTKHIQTSHKRMNIIGDYCPNQQVSPSSSDFSSYTHMNIMQNDKNMFMVTKTKIHYCYFFQKHT
jgi:hypothetical protein